MSTEAGETPAAALCIGRPDAGARELADTLGVSHLAPPALTGAAVAETLDSGSWAFTDTIEGWAAELAAGDPLDRIVLATWLEHPPADSFADLSEAAWLTSVEYELALWARTIVAVAGRAAPGASIAVIVDRPSPLDAVGHVPALAVAEGLRILARSAALVHGERMVRINTIAASLDTSARHLVGMAPALPTFPGRIAIEIAGAVRALWRNDTIGVTGTVLTVDGGRSW